MRSILAILITIASFLCLSAFATAQVATTMAVTSPTANSLPYGVTPFVLNVAAVDGTIPNGLVIYQVDSGPILGAGPLDGNGNDTVAVSPMAIGSHTLVFEFTGNASYAPSSVGYTLQVVQNVISIRLTANPTTLTYGGSTLVDAAIQGASTYSGSMTLFVDGNMATATSATNQSDVKLLASNLPGGTHQLVIQFISSDGNTVNTVSNSVQVDVATFTPNVSVGGSPNPSQQGNSVQITGQVTLPGNFQGATPTGSIDFVIDGQDAGTIPLNSVSSFATFGTASMGAGQHTVTANYSGDGNYSAVSNSYMQTVIPIISQTATNLATDFSSYSYNQTVQASVAVTSNGPFSPSGTVVIDDGVVQVGTGNLNGNGQVTVPITGLGFGTHNLVAIYQGSGSFSTSNSSTVTITVSQATPTLQVVGPSQASLGSSVVITATPIGPFGGTPTGTVTVTDGSATFGPFAVTSSGAACSFVPPSGGTQTINFAYSGDANFTSANTSAILNVAQGNVTITMSDTNQVYNGHPEPVQVQVQPGTPSTITYNGSTTVPENVGTYAVTVTVNTNGRTGYLSGTLVISPAHLIVNVSNSHKFLGAQNPGFSGTTSGAVGSDNISATFWSPAITTTDVGAYPINATLNDPKSRLSNYTVTINVGVLSILYNSNTGFVQPIRSNNQVTSLESTAPLAVSFAVYDGNHNPVTNGAVVSMQLIAIDGSPATGPVSSLNNVGWYVSNNYNVYNLLVAGQLVGHNYTYELLLKDLTTMEFTIRTP